MKIKIVTSAVFLLAIVYSIVSTKINSLDTKSYNLCDFKIISLIATWDSGCYYSAAFDNSPSSQKLQEEYSRLKLFDERGGIVQHIHWYKSLFYQKFRQEFKFSWDEVEAQHRRFTQANPVRTASQLAYLQFLFDSGMPKLAQNHINYYCKTFLSSHSIGLLQSLEYSTLKAKLPLDYAECLQVVGVE